MWRIFKALLFLAVLAAIIFVSYAYVGPVFFPADFAAPGRVVTEPVLLNLDEAG